ncbi:MAG: winged helix-turn-helix domain-containing protein [Actinomycetota bacterium]|nr:winged helix-turn-helix domain-containing protein [Actinomycetota bacterium]
MRFGILGPLEVFDDHGRPVVLSARKERALLAILLLHANRVVSAERLVEDLWSGDPPASAVKGLQVHVSRLRRRLAMAAAAPGEERLLTEASGYRLKVAAGELDSERFEGLLQRASGLIAAGGSEPATEMLRDALALWRGGAFSDFEYEEFAQAEIARLSELRVVAVEQRIAAELELGRSELVIGELARLVRDHPYRERLRGQLMLALFRSGRQAEALDAFRDARAGFVEQLGLEPSIELRELHDAILAQDESLAYSTRKLGRTDGEAVSAGDGRERGEPVTLLHAEADGAAALARRLGPAGWAGAIGAHQQIVAETAKRYGGRVVEVHDHASLVLFADAAAAVLAARDAQRVLSRHRGDDEVRVLKVRMGLHTGVVERRRSSYVGLDLQLAARVAAAANGGQILITAATRRRLGPSIETLNLGEHRLADFPEPERLYHVVLQGDDRVPRPRTEKVRPTNLPPQPRAMVGRKRELRELRELLLADDRQIVTIAGIGGSGKTRLAVAAAHELLDEFPGGVFLVRLAGVSDPASLLPMIAEAAGVTGQSQLPLWRVLAARLGAEPTLLVLDNFEQLVAAATLLDELVEGSDELRVLVTSQVPLRIAAERIVALAPLADDDAVGLFIERARIALPEFAPRGGDLDAIGQICARVDRMPLAIELAAARLSTLAPRVLAQKLERPLALLTRGERDAPARQSSLRAAIEWTHALLDPAPRSLFARLGVCAGAVPLTAVEAIAPTGMGEPELLDALAALLDYSFVRRQEDRRLGVRFLIPQALRDFALERLIESDLEDETRGLHADHVARVAHAARLVKWGASDEERAELLAVSGEIRPAVAWARERDPQLHVRICAALASYWVYGGVLSEVTEELGRARASAAGSAAERAWFLTALAKCAQLQSVDVDVDPGELADHALAEWRAVDDEVERALGLGYLSWVVRWESRYGDAIAMAQESLAVLRGTADRRLILRGLVFLAHAYADSQDLAHTEAVLKEADKLADGEPVWELAAIHGDCAWIKGDDLVALSHYVESLAWTSTTGESHQMLMDIGCIVPALARLGEGEAALEVFELLRLERRRTGRPGDLPTAMVWLLQAVTAAHEQAGPDAAKRAGTRAGEVPETGRAAHTAEVVNGVLARATSAEESANSAQAPRPLE